MTFHVQVRGAMIAAGSLAALGAVAMAIAVRSQADTWRSTGRPLAQANASRDPKSPIVGRSEKAQATDDGQSADASRARREPAPAAPLDEHFQLVEQLQSAGVKRCLPLADGMGRFEMTGVTQYAVTSTWSRADPDQRLFSSLMGQRFSQNAAAPVGISGVVSALSSNGKCDALGFQVLPTTSTCSAVQAQVLVEGEWLGEMAGVPILRNAQNLRVMLLPTAGDGCVIVGVKNYYSE